VAISLYTQTCFTRENAFYLVADVFTRTKVPAQVKFSVYMISSNRKGNVFFSIKVCP